MTYPMEANTYISLLRGINVGGQKKILMEDLKTLYRKLDFTRVTTYIQSGNVIFDTGKDRGSKELAGIIEKEIERKYCFYVPVIVRTLSEILHAQAINPFLQEAGINRDKLHVTFLEHDPDPAILESVSKFDFSPDRFMILKKDVYIYCPEGYGGTKIDNSFFENRLKVKATTRNWKTVVKLVEIALEKEK
jgi:uncharacterized protein (DUF1697 family)